MVKLKDSLLREHLTKATKVALHPIRRKVLKLLKDGSSLSTIDIIDRLDLNKEDRYNLYHHLTILENFNLIKKDTKLSIGKTQYYKINKPKNPIMMAYSYDEDEIKENKDEISTILDSLSKIENHKIGNKDKIKSIEINILCKK